MRITFHRHLPLAAICLATFASAHAQTMQAPDITKQPDALRGALRASRHAMALGVSADHQRIPAEDHAGELRSHREISALRFQLDRRQPLPADEGILPAGLREGEEVRRRRPLVSRRARRWKRATSTCPAPEAIIRQVLYGNTYFRKEFGKASAEFMLPDCFGFPASLPSILAHAGVKGFSTQKLSSGWQPAPKVGGPDSPEQTPDGHSVQRGHLGRPRRQDRSSRRLIPAAMAATLPPTSARSRDPAKPAAGTRRRSRTGSSACNWMAK